MEYRYSSDIERVCLRTITDQGLHQNYFFILFSIWDARKDSPCDRFSAWREFLTNFTTAAKNEFPRTMLVLLFVRLPNLDASVSAFESQFYCVTHCTGGDSSSQTRLFTFWKSHISWGWCLPSLRATEVASSRMRGLANRPSLSPRNDTPGSKGGGECFSHVANSICPGRLCERNNVVNTNKRQSNLMVADLRPPRLEVDVPKVESNINSKNDCSEKMVQC